MPLPMPRWVMSSPIHISSAVPAVRVSTTSSTRGSGEVGQQVEVAALPRPKSRPPPLWNRKARPVAWMTAMAIVR